MYEYNGEDRRAHQWHLEKSISVGHIITTVALAGSVFAWAMQMDTRVSVIEAQIAHAAEARAKIEAQYRDGMSEIKSSLLRIEAKLDGKQDKFK